MDNHNLENDSINRSIFREFYDNYYKIVRKTNPAHEIYDSIRVKTIKQLLISEQGKNLIVGCGNNRDMDIFSEKTTIYALDLSWYAIAQIKLSRKNRTNMFLSVADALNIPYPSKFFDVIICSEVLEHIPSIERAIREMYRVIKPNGYLIVSSPNWNSLFGVARKIYETFTGNYFHSSDQPYDDWKTLKKYKKSLEPYFKIQKVRGVWFLPPLHIRNKGLSPSITKFIYKIYAPWEQILSKKLPSLGHIIILVCSPSPDLIS